MTKWVLVTVCAAACSGSSNHKGSDAAIVLLDAPPDSSIVLVDAPPDAAGVTCNPLTQTGCPAGDKCTWLVDALSPQYVGHIGCSPQGTVAVDGACQYGAPGPTGYDNCVGGAVCSSTQGTPGTCRAICDNQGGAPMCDATHGCVAYTGIFTTGPTTPQAAGLCDPACNPLDDNDFDGPGSVLARVGSACGAATIGCYGIPSGGTAPATTFTCAADIHYTTPLHHRTECTQATGCTDGGNAIYVNSCNQGYLPLFRESTAVSTAVCVAMCKPIDCYSGNCGAGDVNRIGAAPHRCTTPDALGSFGSDENCEYLWAEEMDGMGTWLPSPTSNTVGFCFDHSQYKYDPTGGNNPTIPLPSCEQLQLHSTGTDPSMPLTYFGATDFGCVSTTTGGITFSGKLPARKFDGVRVPYHPTMR